MAMDPDTFLVYIVDDDDSVRRSLSRLMRASRVPSQAFATAGEFLAAVGPESEGCVLLDLSVPLAASHDVQAALATKAAALPVIIVSASDDQDMRDAAFALGAKFFLRKPVDEQALLDAIAWVRTAERRRGAPDKDVAC